MSGVDPSTFLSLSAYQPPSPPSRLEGGNPRQAGGGRRLSCVFSQGMGRDIDRSMMIYWLCRNPRESPSRSERGKNPVLKGLFRGVSPPGPPTITIGQWTVDIFRLQGLSIQGPILSGGPGAANGVSTRKSLIFGVSPPASIKGKRLIGTSLHGIIGRIDRGRRASTKPKKEDQWIFTPRRYAPLSGTTVPATCTSGMTALRAGRFASGMTKA